MDVLMLHYLRPVAGALISNIHVVAAAIISAV